MFFTIGIAAVQVPYIQNKLVDYTTGFLSKYLNYPILIGSLSISWVDKLVLHDVVIKDTKGIEMIKVESVVADFRLLSLLGRDIIIDEVVLNKPYVIVKWYEEVDDVNISDFIYSIQHIGEDSVERNKPGAPHVGRYQQFIVKKVSTINGNFIYDDNSLVKSKTSFDFSSFQLDSVAITASNFKIIADTISMDINNISCIDRFSKLKVHYLKSHFYICEKSMQLENLDSHIGDTYFKDFLKFDFQEFGQLSHINDSVNITLNITDSEIYSKDLAVFIPDLKGFDEVWKVSGKFKGFFNDFMISDLNLAFGKQSFLYGSAKLKGLPVWEETLLLLDFKSSLFYVSDLEKYGLIDYKKELSKFNRIHFSSTFKGYPKDFRVEGKFQTDLGGINAYVNIKVPDEYYKGKYDGVFSLKDFEMGLLTEVPKLQLISANFRIEGEGFNTSNVNSNLSGIIDLVGIDGYNYENAFISTKLVKKNLQMALDLNDTNIVMDVIAKIDLEKEILEVDANLKKANIDKLGYFHKALTTSCDLKYQSKGFNLETYEGNISASDISIKSGKDDVFCNTFQLDYGKLKSNERKLALTSDFANAEINGVFELKKLSENLTELANDVLVTYEKSDTAQQKYFNKKVIDERKFQRIEYSFDLKNIGTLCKIFVPKIYISPKSSLSGSFTSINKKSLTLNFLSDTFRYNSSSFAGNILDFYVSKSNEVSSISSVLIIKSQAQSINEVTSTEDLFLRAAWLDKKIDFEARVKQQNETNQLNVAGSLELNDELKRLAFTSAHLKLLDKDWIIDKENEIVFKPDLVLFNHVELKSDSQQIAFTGELSTVSGSEFTMSVKDFNLQNLNKVLNQKFEGKLNGFMAFKDFYREIKINSDLNIKHLKINKLIIGNIAGKTDWDNINGKMNLEVGIERNGNKMFDLIGYYAPGAPDSSRLNVKAILNKTHLIVIEPFIQDIISHLDGEATGVVRITGSLNNPKLNGEIEIQDGSLKVNYLNTTYYFTQKEKITIKHNGFVLNDIVLSDGSESGGLAVVEGGIYHENFKKFRITIGGEFKNTEILNTTIKNNELYYGTAIASGTFSIKGDFNTLNLKVDAKALKGTKLFIPYSTSAEVKNQEFISFVKKEKSKKQELKATSINSNASNNLTIRGEFNIELTPDAYNEFILDQTTGDKISGYGHGKIRLEFDSEGDFTMFGDFIFDKESYYTFTFLNVINKRFVIKGGSSLTWSGSPYNGILDVTATYNDRVSLHTLDPDTLDWQKPGMRTPYPVSTILYLSGDLLSPTISYDIKITNYPAVISGVPLFNYVSAFENKIHSNVNEMNTQVFSLLVFRKFIYGSQFFSNAAGGTVSELLTNQLSQVISQIDKNLQVDVRMNGLNRDALNAMQLRVSYDILDGKVRITRSGSFTNSQSQATAASVIGDVSIEYMLTDDGRFRAKAFTRNNPNTLATGTGTQNSNSTGVSLMHTTSFDNLNPFRKKKKRKKSDK